MRQPKGFTLIELLIVIAVLGILIIAILSAIDPLEQIRKARDSGRKSDSGQLMSAYERYFSTFQCHPWDTNSPNCSTVVTASRTTGVVPDFTSTTGDDWDLIEQGELKDAFANRQSITNSEMWVSEDARRNVSVCFEPESRSARQGGMGTLFNNSIAGSVITACPVVNSYPTSDCFICLPQ